MLLNTSRLVIKGPKGVFTEKGGIVDPYKLCFPHYSCKDTVNDFGFVTDFKIEATKDRYMFFSAIPMKTVLPTYDEIIQAIINTNDIEFVDDGERKHYIIHDGFIYGNYVCILFQVRNKVLWLIITKNADTGDAVYTFVEKNHQQCDTGRIIISTNICEALYKMQSIYKDDTFNDFISSFVEHIVKDTLYYSTRVDLMTMYAIYTRKQLRYMELNKSLSKYYMDDSIKSLQICDRFYIERMKHTIDDTVQVSTIICDNIFTLIMDYSSKIGNWMKLIGIDRLSEVLEEMKMEKSYPRLERQDYLSFDRDTRWPIADAYEKGYITFIDNTSSYCVYKYNPKNMFIRWNSLLDYKKYEHYEEMNKIINEEEREINSLIKSLGKIGSAEAIKELKILSKIKTIYNIH